MPTVSTSRLRASAARQVAWLLGLLTLAFLVTVSMSTWQTISSINTVSAENSRQAVLAAFVREAERVKRYAQSHDDWDDEVLEESEEDEAHEPAARKHVPRVIARTVEADGNFDEMWILSTGGETAMTLRADTAAQEALTTPDAQLAKRLIASYRNSGLAQTSYERDGADVAVYSLMPLPADSDLTRAAGIDGPAMLLVHEDITQDFLNKTGEMLQLQGMRFVSDRSRARDAEDFIALKSTDGQIVGRVEWVQGHNAPELLARQLPLLLTLAAIFIAAGLMLWRRLQSSLAFLNRQARTDWLSRLPNRWALQHAIRDAAKSGEPSALAMVDLDSFKTINDFHGHKTGDEVIKYVARLLSGISPRNTFVARLGGDEFALFLTGPDSDRLLRLAAEDLLAELSEPVDIDGHLLMVGCSIGIATMKDGRPTIDMLRRADIAMYAAKQSGRMCYALYDEEMEHETNNGLALKDGLIAAMQAGEIGLKYQPIMSARTGQIVGVEALARWTCSKNGPISPDQFIPVAERFGLIGAIGKKLLRDACDALAPYPDIRLAVNISAAQISRPDFVDNVMNALEESGMPPQRFELEITETSLVKDGPSAQRALELLSAMGVRIALDDFGTGYASIGFLRQFHFDSLKIDRSIISDCVSNTASLGVIQACVAMANALDIEVVAEGIETPEQETILRVAGCDYLQGWLYSRAVDLSDLELGRDDSPLKLVSVA
jgi:diguanylate cyclase (GGDEF)-like protein